MLEMLQAFELFDLRLNDKLVKPDKLWDVRAHDKVMQEVGIYNVLVVIDLSHLISCASTVNLQIIAMFLLLQKIGQGSYHNELNSILKFTVCFILQFLRIKIIVKNQRFAIKNVHHNL